MVVIEDPSIKDQDSANKAARAYQIRLELSDLEDPVMLARLAVEAHVSPAEFKKRFRRAATPIAELEAEETAAAAQPEPAATAT